MSHDIKTFHIQLRSLKAKPHPYRKLCYIFFWYRLSNSQGEAIHQFVEQEEILANHASGRRLMFRIHKEYRTK